MKRVLPLAGCAVAVVAVLLGGIWGLTQTLGSHETLYRGQSLAAWQIQLTNRDPALSRQSATVIEREIVPQLIQQAFHDTNDSRLRLLLIDQLNSLPGVQISFAPADSRRAAAVEALGNLGASAKAAGPALLEALRGQDGFVRSQAATALGQIPADPKAIIPALLTCLSNPTDNARAEAALTLAEFGSQSQAAVPILIQLLDDRSSKDLMRAVRTALTKIDPEAAAKAGLK